jgi:F-box domain
MPGGKDIVRMSKVGLAVFCNLERTVFCLKMNDLGILPIELIVAIFEWLDIPSLLAVSAVSSSLSWPHEVGND